MTMQQPFLSICIPTFNRCEWLIKAIDSVLAQEGFDDRIEIVVSDNASTDATALEVARLCGQYHNMRYSCLSANGGFDHNMIHVLAAARGEYCWLFGDDDKMAPGALQRVLGDLKQGPDLLLVNRFNCDSQQIPHGQQSWLNVKQPTTYDFACETDRLQYLRHTRSLGALFSFISCLIVRRSALQLSDIPDAVFKTGYVHAFLCLRDILLAGKRLDYDPQPLVLCRWPESVNPRVSIMNFTQDVTSYLHFSQALFPEHSSMRLPVHTVLRREHPWGKMLYLFSQYPEERQGLFQLAREIGYPEGPLHSLSIVARADSTRWILGRLHRFLRRLRRGV